MKGRDSSTAKRHVAFHGHAHTPRRVRTDEVMMLRDLEKNGQRLPHISDRCCQREIRQAIADVQHKAIQPKSRTHPVKEFDESCALLRPIFFVIYDEVVCSVRLSPAADRAHAGYTRWYFRPPPFPRPLQPEISATLSPGNVAGVVRQSLVRRSFR